MGNKTAELISRLSSALRTLDSEWTSSVLTFFQRVGNLPKVQWSVVMVTLKGNRSSRRDCVQRCWMHFVRFSIKALWEREREASEQRLTLHTLLQMMPAKSLIQFSDKYKALSPSSLSFICGSAIFSFTVTPPRKGQWSPCWNLLAWNLANNATVLLSFSFADCLTKRLRLSVAFR